MIPAIEITNLQFRYPDGRQVLHGINLQIQPGESVGLIGPNGAGKTTLLLHLNGILCGAGDVRVLGLRCEKDNLKSIRSKVGLVFQDPDDQLFSQTVFDDVAFGPLNMGLPAEEVKLWTREALAQVGMQEYESNVPHHLSLGEKKRVSIATIFSMRPEIMVLDEPTSNLDPRQRKHLIDLLKSVNVTKIIAGHDLAMIGQLCGRVLLLNNGMIMRDGPTGDILSDVEVMNSNGLEVLGR